MHGICNVDCRRGPNETTHIHHRHRSTPCLRSGLPNFGMSVRCHRASPRPVIYPRQVVFEIVSLLRVSCCVLSRTRLVFVSGVLLLQVKKRRHFLACGSVGCEPSYSAMLVDDALVRQPQGRYTLRGGDHDSCRSVSLLQICRSAACNIHGRCSHPPGRDACRNKRSIVTVETMAHCRGTAATTRGSIFKAFAFLFVAVSSTATLLFSS